MNDHIDDAFPDFNSPGNKLAAAQYCLNECVRGTARDCNWDPLCRLMDVTDEVVSIGGDPGWVIDARKPNVALEEYEGWPDWANYRAAIDQEDFGLQAQETFFTKSQLIELLRRLVAAYLSEHRNLLARAPELFCKQMLESRPGDV